MTVLSSKAVILGVTGSIAAYKAAELASTLTQSGALVDVVMTESAQRFISPITMRAITHRPVAIDMWETPVNYEIEHISLAEAADALLVAPATANIIAKLANGLADDLLSATALATKAPIIIAPAMNDNMYSHPATQENITRLRTRGVSFVEPDFGRLASGKMGRGRLAGLEEITGVLCAVLGREGDLAGWKVVITAGGTREPLDPVRYLGNRSSGKMGFALAVAARDRGAQVTLISAADCSSPAGVLVVPVDTASQMRDAVVDAVNVTDALIMAAAVADYRATDVAVNKVKKSEEKWHIELMRTPDILQSTRGPFIRIGFAAESEDLISNARGKLVEKELDLIVANDITELGAGFAVDTNRVSIIGRDGVVETLPTLSKREVADRILSAMVKMGKLQNS